MRKWPLQVGTVVANVGRELLLLKMVIKMANADYLSFFLWNELEPRCQQRAAGSLELLAPRTHHLLRGSPRGDNSPHLVWRITMDLELSTAVHSRACMAWTISHDVIWDGWLGWLAVLKMTNDNYRSRSFWASYNALQACVTSRNSHSFSEAIDSSSHTWPSANCLLLELCKETVK